MSEEQKTALRNMQLNASDTRVYFISPETMVIDAHFGSSSKPRTFLVNGQPLNDTSNTFLTTSPSQNSGKFNVQVAKNVGKYAISHPYKVCIPPQPFDVLLFYNPGLSPLPYP